MNPIQKFLHPEVVKKPSRTLPTKAMLFIRMILGCYLFYICSSVVNLINGSTRQWEKVLVTVILIIFVVAGIMLITVSARDLYVGKHVGGIWDAGDLSEEKDENGEPVAPRKRITFDEETDDIS